VEVWRKYKSTANPASFSTELLDQNFVPLISADKLYVQLLDFPLVCPAGAFLSFGQSLGSE